MVMGTSDSQRQDLPSDFPYGIQPLLASQIAMISPSLHGSWGRPANSCVKNVLKVQRKDCAYDDVMARYIYIYIYHVTERFEKC